MAFAILLTLATSIKLAFGFSALCWFALGTLAAIQPAYPLVGRWSVAAVAMIFFIGVPVTASETFAIGAADSIPATLYQICFAVFVAGWIKQLANARTSIFDAFQSLGAYSYTLYVIHIPLVTIALAICSPLANFSLLTIATLATTFAAVQILAYVFSVAVERPRFFYLVMEAGISRIRLACSILSG
jgi:hypothetical protein